MKKKILFVINTLSRAGAETALLELLAQLAAERGRTGPPRYELASLSWMNQENWCSRYQRGCVFVNPRYARSRCSNQGRIYMGMTVVKCLLHNLIRPWRLSSEWLRAGDAQRGTADAGQTAVAGNLGWRQALPGGI